MIAKEIVISVPWGIISGRTWGNERDPKILMLHGRFDNIESFAELLPLLPQSYFYIAVDLPGHGTSSHLPPNVDCGYWDFIMAIRLVVNFLKEGTNIILLGHSFGGGLLLTYTQLYPEDVSKLILIDANYFRSFEAQVFKAYSRHHIDGACKLLARSSTAKPPTFTYAEGLKALLDRRMYGEIAQEPAERIYKRNLLKVAEGKYQMAGDPRIKIYPYFILNANTINRLIKHHPIRCPMLSIVAARSEMPPPDREFLAKLEKLSTNCITKVVDGNHHMHANCPQIVAPLICDFLKPKSNL
ncbi:serine hydrolase-like protein [Photinus pyralis]|nr:serine hydrolase-like protein [Photinus pyralis]